MQPLDKVSQNTPVRQSSARLCLHRQELPNPVFYIGESTILFQKRRGGQNNMHTSGTLAKEKVLDHQEIHVT